jgi:hypothetical protein
MFGQLPRPPWHRKEECELPCYVQKNILRFIGADFDRLSLAHQPQGHKKIAEEIYHRLLKKEIIYDNPKFSKNSGKQHIRDAEDILYSSRRGTCLDLAVLYAGLLLDVELLPVLILIEGHALVAVSTTHFLTGWKAPGRPLCLKFQDVIKKEDKDAFVNAVKNGSLLAIECTGFAKSAALDAPNTEFPETVGRDNNGYMTFERAVAAGAEQLQGNRGFLFALDVATFRYGDWEKLPIEPPRYGANDLSGAARIFFDYYVGTGEKRRLFAGRDDAIARLDQWLAGGDEPPRILVEGPSGTGKSALLAQWADRLKDQDKYGVLLLPIGVRFGSSDPATIYEALAVKLSGLQGELLPQPSGSANKSDFYRDQIINLLRDVRPYDGRTSVLILDGVNEAPGLRIDEFVLPKDMSPYLRVVISIRTGLDGQPEPRVNLPDPKASPFAEPVVLKPIDREGMRALVDALLCAPAPADRDVLTDRLSALTKGDPLLLGYYCEILDEEAERRGGAPATIDTLRDFEPGLSSLIEQELRFHLEGQIPDAAIDAAFGALAVALAPLPISDFLGVLKQLNVVEPEARSTRTALSRFIMSSAGELSLRHERFTEYVRNERPNGQKIVARSTAALLAYQRDAAERLSQGSDDSASRYVMRHYARHLMTANAMDAADCTRLVSKGWLRCRLDAENGGRIGVADDARTVLQYIRRLDGPRDQAAMTAALRAALVLSSLRASDAVASPSLVRLARRYDLISGAEAEAVAAAQPPATRAESLAALALDEPEPAAQERLRNLVLAAVLQAHREDGSASIGQAARDALAPVFNSGQVVKVAADLAAAVKGKGNVDRALAHVIVGAAPAQHVGEIAEFLAPKMFDPSAFFLVCAKRAEGPLRDHFLTEALSAAKKHGDLRVDDEVDVLLIVAPEEAKRRAREWALGLESQHYLGAHTLTLGALFNTGALAIPDLEKALGIILARNPDGLTRFDIVRRFGKLRDDSAVVDRIIREALRDAANEDFMLARTALASCSTLAPNERAGLLKAILAESPDRKPVNLARLLRSMPINDPSYPDIARVAREAMIARRNTPLYVKYLFELWTSNDADIQHWCALEALQAASESMTAYEWLDDRLSLCDAHIPDRALAKSLVAKILRRVRTIEDTVEQWRFQIGLLDTPTAFSELARRARDAVDSGALPLNKIPDYLEIVRTALPADEYRKALDSALSRQRQALKTIDPRELAHYDRLLGLQMLIGMIPPEQIRKNEWAEYFAIFNQIDDGFANAKAHYVQRFPRFFRQVPAGAWFQSLEAALRADADKHENWTEYWLTLACAAPARMTRWRALWSGWKYFRSGKAWAWGGGYVRAQALLTLAEAAPSALAHRIRKHAWRLALTDKVPGAEKNLAQFITDHAKAIPRSMLTLAYQTLDGLLSNEASREQASLAALRVAGAGRGASLRRRALENPSPKVLAEYLSAIDPSGRNRNLTLSLIAAAGQEKRPQALSLLARATPELRVSVGSKLARMALDDMTELWPVSASRSSASVLHPSH